MPNQVIRPATAVMLANQLKTRPEPDLTPIKPRAAKRELKITDTQGRPLGKVLRKMRGALPAAARPSVGRRLGL